MKSRSQVVVLLLALGLGLGTRARAQQDADAPPPAPPSAAANLPALPLGPNDLIAVQTYGAPELATAVRIAADGSLQLPFLSQPIPAGGLLPPALGIRIEQEMLRERLLLDPVVQVTVQEYRSHPIAVMGAVQHPLIFQAYPGVTLLDALARAGGLTSDAGPEVVISRGPESPIQVDVHALLGATDPAANLRLQGGEQVRIPEMMKLYVVGNVMKPGLVRIDEPADATVLTAIAVAGGLKDYTGTQAFIYRLSPDVRSRVEIAVPLRDILHRKAQDPLLQPNDVVMIPDSSGKRFTARTLAILGTAGATALGAYAVYH